MIDDDDNGNIMKTNNRGVNLVWKLGVVPSWDLKVHRAEPRSTRLRVSFQEFLFNLIQIFLFLKSHHLGKCSHIIFLDVVHAQFHSPFVYHDDADGYDIAAAAAAAAMMMTCKLPMMLILSLWPRFVCSCYHFVPYSFSSDGSGNVQQVYCEKYSWTADLLLRRR